MMAAIIKAQPPLFLIDCDGTLCDTLPLWENLAAEDLLARGIAPLDDLSEALASLTVAEAAAYIIAHYPLSLSEEALMSAWEARLAAGYRHRAPAKEGAMGALHLLRKRALPACCVTLSPRNLVDPLLRRTGLYPYLSDLVSGHDLGLGKSDGALFDDVARQNKRPAEACIVVDDSLFALERAKAEGFVTIAFYDPFHGAEDWQRASDLADFAVRNWRDFFALIAAWHDDLPPCLKPEGSSFSTFFRG